jgi:outer membrane protein OmpA-like peptidoglycan-associated protein
MSRISPFLWATAVIFAASTSVYGVPSRATSAPDMSFSVFFEPGAASLTKEGQEIVLVVAKRFETAQVRHAAAHIIVTAETDDQDNATLSDARVKAVSDQLVSDGIRRQFVSSQAHPSLHAKPVRLLESLNQRVSISIQENPVAGRIVG